MLLGDVWISLEKTKSEIVQVSLHQGTSRCLLRVEEVSVPGRSKVLHRFLLHWTLQSAEGPGPDAPSHGHAAAATAGGG